MKKRILAADVDPFGRVRHSRTLIIRTRPGQKRCRRHLEVVVVHQHDRQRRGQELMGQKPIGFITYTPDGRMSVVITAETRKPLSVNDRIAAPADERAEAFSTVIAYAGRYSFTSDKIVHHVEASWMPNQVGTDLVRSLKLEGDRLTLRTTPILQGGAQTTTDLVWERLK